MDAKTTNKLIKFLKGRFITRLKAWVRKKLISKILGGAVGGIKGWIVKVLFERVWKKYIGPVVKKGTVKVIMLVRKPITKKKLKKIQGAESEEEFNDAFDNLP